MMVANPDLRASKVWASAGIAATRMFSSIVRKRGKLAKLIRVLRVRCAPCASNAATGTGLDCVSLVDFIWPSSALAKSSAEGTNYLVVFNVVSLSFAKFSAWSNFSGCATMTWLCISGRRPITKWCKQSAACIPKRWHNWRMSVL